MAAEDERADRRAELIDAATEVFWRKGFTAASVRDVADKVGVLKGSLYHYIDSKDALLFAIFDESHEQASRIVADVAALKAPPLERLRIFLQRYLEWYLVNVEQVSVYFREWKHLTEPRREIVQRQRAAFDDLARGLLDEAQGNGEIDAGLDVGYATFFVLGALEGAGDWYRRDGPATPQHIAAEYARMAVQLVTSPSPSATGRSPRGRVRQSAGS
jgi:TetR/AcrR family transcriptional regulator, cholesterol catabolism regulator